MFSMSLLQGDGKFLSMRIMVDVLLELGGDLGKVNIVGNDFVAVAGTVAAGLQVYVKSSVLPCHTKSVECF